MLSLLKHFSNTKEDKIVQFDKIYKNNYDLISFDVFDTLVTRTTFYPSGIFLLMQNELLFNSKYADIPEFVKCNFRNIRYGTENFFNRTKRYIYVNRILNTEEAQQEFSLEEFYNHIAKQYDLNQEQIKKLINLEIELEIKNSIPVRENINRLKKLVSLGKRVVLVSDMYLKSETIRKILVSHDEIFNDISIYVSSEYMQTKSTGNLYHIVAKNENITDYTKWLHIGDNENSDIKNAEKLNIKTLYYPKEDCTEFEKDFYSNVTLTSLPEAQILLGSSINTRRFLKNNSMSDFATIATSVFYPYVKWLIKKSISKGINRLYFVARDGYVLKKIADTIIEQEQIKNLNTYYIYGSRQAWRMPCAKNFEDIATVFNSFVNQTSIKDVACLLGIEPDEFIKFLPQMYLVSDKILSEEDLRTIQTLLKDNSEFIDFILSKHKNSRELLIEYLRQNIDTSDENFAFVDLTCSGITNSLLANLIHENFGVKSKCFFISLSRKISNDKVEIYNYLSLFYYYIIIELLGRAPHGQTTGYKFDNHAVVPILDENEKIDNFKEYEDAIVYQTKLLNSAININQLKNLDNLSYVLMTEIYKNQTKDIAKYFLSIPFSTVRTLDKAKLKKGKLSIIDVINYYYYSKKNLIHSKNMDFALKNSSPMANCLAEFFKSHKNINHKNIKKSVKYTCLTIKHKL